MKIRRRAFEKWRMHTLPHVMRFYPCSYASGGGLFGEAQSGKPQWDGASLSAEEAFYVWESRGIDARASCADATKLKNLLAAKDGMNLMLGMWKETLRDDGRGYDGKGYGRLMALVLLSEITEEHPIEWVEQVGLLATTSPPVPRDSLLTFMRVSGRKPFAKEVASV